ncbi:hypothetical protein [Mucilaginibacter paludis]|uniref:Lipoprotein n=1 Tax=Mucilaginibacter paludis DSM 18603 TaxID=714943 RepID=H1YBN5_9SPHI|nr:hypothetical protein [Mucilaginibacter paludis]EHQ25998.1 hypothetical protein Mucpa_1845 [Mucilaginibacter paludis DSM 18603]
MLKFKLQNIFLCGLSLLLFATGCSKVNYAKIDDPAYLRVFNNLNYTISLENKDEPVPFLAMLIDPQMDQNNIPVSAAITGDFLDQREPYAPPYPSHVGTSISYKNPEYPGKEDVLVGPILNGFDLSSWAQIPSGKHRIVFMFRPVNNTPFFNLESKLKRSVLIDTTITLDAKEIYTLHVLQKDFVSKKNGIYLRQENFQKLSLSDSLVYINFYNMSAKGFQQANSSLKTSYAASGALQDGIKDEMNIFYTLYKTSLSINDPLPAYTQKYMGNLTRNSESPAVNPYYSFPLFADGSSNGIVTGIWQHIDLMAPGFNPSNNPYYPFEVHTDSNWAPINCILTGKTRVPGNDNAALLPNMIVNIPSGKYNLRSFATVNTIEIVNGNVYLTTIQRKYAPPTY